MLGPLWRLMIASRHRRCFPKQTCPNKIKCAQAALAASLLKNIIVIEGDKILLFVAMFWSRLLRSLSGIVFSISHHKRFRRWLPDQIWTNRTAHWVNLAPSVGGYWRSNKKPQTRMIRLEQLNNWKPAMERAIKSWKIGIIWKCAVGAEGGGPYLD